MKAWQKLARGKASDEFIDFIFQRFVKILEKDIKGVYRIKNLTDPGTQEPMFGYLNHRTIYLEHRMSKQELIKTLIHELAHFLFDAAPEQTIRKIEDILWKKFAKKEKRVLEKYIPKRAAAVKIT